MIGFSTADLPWEPHFYLAMSNQVFREIAVATGVVDGKLFQTKLQQKALHRLTAREGILSSSFGFTVKSSISSGIPKISRTIDEKPEFGTDRFHETSSG